MEKMPSSPLKAYVITELCEDTGGVVFARFHAEARRRGAGEFADGDWDSVECRRAREFDAFAPGPVPMAAFLAQGWWFECNYCYEHLGQADGPLIHGRHLYCDRWCRLREVEDSGRQEAEKAIGAVMCRLALPYDLPRDIAGCLTTRRDGRGVYRNSPGARFNLPGLSGYVEWSSADPEVCSVAKRDLPAFEAWRAANVNQGSASADGAALLKEAGG